MPPSHALRIEKTIYLIEAGYLKCGNKVPHKKVLDIWEVSVYNAFVFNKKRIKNDNKTNKNG